MSDLWKTNDIISNLLHNQGVEPIWQKRVGRRQNSASMNVILPFPLLSDCQIRIKKNYFNQIDE
jgi:hypothetical protein